LSLAIVVAALVLRREPLQVEAAVPAPAIVAEFDTVNVPVPAEVVPANTKIKDIAFKLVAYPAHQVPPGVLTDLDSYLDATTVTVLPANLPMFADNLSRTAITKNPVVERIPPGMRAMTVRVDATAAVEGWAGSGSIVDVLLVENDKTTVVAEKVTILSAERSLAPVDSSSPSVPKTVTLLVTQEQCLAINTAIPIGRIAFALRSGRDEGIWSTTSYSADRLRGSSLVVDRDGTITGVVSVQGRSSVRSFALSDGKWIPAQSVPEGFFVGRETFKEQQ
jgi:Flp pilus assembly protein CpaB